MSTETTPVSALPKFRVVKHVTRPLLKMELDKVCYVEFESKFYEAEKGTQSTRPRPDGDPKPESTGRKMAPPMLADVLDLGHGKRPSVIIVNAVLESELNKKYPSDSYIGKKFGIVKSKLQGKDYATFQIAEVEMDEPSQEQPAQTVPAGSGGKRK